MIKKVYDTVYFVLHLSGVYLQNIIPLGHKRLLKEKIHKLQSFCSKYTFLLFGNISTAMFLASFLLENIGDRFQNTLAAYMAALQ